MHRYPLPNSIFLTMLLSFAAVKASAENKNLEKVKGTIGACIIVPKFGLQSGEYEYHLYPSSAGANISSYKEPLDVQYEYENAEIKVSLEPKHGALKQGEASHQFEYIPNSGYVGKDKISFLVDGDMFSVKVIYFVNVVNSSLRGTRKIHFKKHCKGSGEWLISN